MSTAETTATPVPDPAGRPAPSRWSRVALVVGGLCAVLLVMLTAFALPSVKSSPQDVPVAIVGPDQQVATIEDSIDQAAPGALDLVTAADADAAEQMILDREVYGAFVLGQDGVTVQTASAASYSVASMLTQASQQLGASAGVQVTVEDVVPLPEDDPRGVGLTAGSLPLAIGGLLAAAACIALLHGPTRRIAGAAGFALVGGFALTAVLQYGFGTFDGPYALTALAASLGIGATSMLVLGLERLLGAPGIAVGAVIVVLLGNPLSGIMTAPEYLPEPWGAVGQLLPPGAMDTLLRNVAYFDGAASLGPILVLCGWIVIGLVLFAAGVARSRRSGTEL
ncbi:ABC transporter permease [Paraoerskovia marina]|uniref:ABC transporter permease n=1 Tax=Paraoerskovia marina TaxID=545619 RepID=UPI001B7FF8C2|nr:ABC transporter permease [Paraoerskovia marina]